MTRSREQGAVAVYFTGGTIGMRPTGLGGGVVPTGDFSRLIDEIRGGLTDIRVAPIAWSDLPSPHMTPEHMFRLAKDIEQTLSDPSVKGAVVLHGTDVLVESAFMADITVAVNKPIVFTGSMRYYQELGFDGIRNLLNGIKACLLPLPPETGVVLLMTDRFFTAREVAKISSVNIDAFEAPEAGPVGYVAGESVVITRRPPYYSAPGGRTPIASRTIEPNVPLVSCYTGMDGGIIDYYREKGAGGIVVEAFGAGNIPPSIVDALDLFLAENKPVVLTTRCVEGGVWPIYGYTGGGADLVRRGVIPGGRLSGPKARLLLMVALGAGLSPDEIHAIYEKDLAVDLAPVR